MTVGLKLGLHTCSIKVMEKFGFTEGWNSLQNINAKAIYTYFQKRATDCFKQNK